MKYFFATILYKRYDHSLHEHIFFTEKQVFSFNTNFTIEELQYKCSLRNNCEFQSVVELQEVAENVVESLKMQILQS